MHYKIAPTPTKLVNIESNRSGGTKYRPNQLKERVAKHYPKRMT